MATLLNEPLQINNYFIFNENLACLKLTSKLKLTFEAPIEMVLAKNEKRQETPINIYK